MVAKLPDVLHITELMYTIFNLVGASDVAVLCHIFEITLSERDRRIYLDPIRDLGAVGQTLLRLRKDGMVIGLMGVDIERLRMRIGDPATYWGQPLHYRSHTIVLAVLFAGSMSSRKIDAIRSLYGLIPGSILGSMDMAIDILTRQYNITFDTTRSSNLGLSTTLYSTDSDTNGIDLVLPNMITINLCEFKSSNIHMTPYRLITTDDLGYTRTRFISIIDMLKFDTGTGSEMSLWDRPWHDTIHYSKPISIHIVFGAMPIWGGIMINGHTMCTFNINNGSPIFDD